jgi:hypothetical protein
VRGTVIAVTAVMLTYQWAEITRMAVGVGRVDAKEDQASV